MPAHWTYEPFAADSDLEQGDILYPSEALRGIFSEVHPHFRSEKYLAFLIATQSCDLVRRQEAPKASYISLAAIRPLAQVVHKILSGVADPVAVGVFRSSSKREARQLLQRLLNQNEQSLGLFYLQTDVDAGIAEPAVAFLRVTVALRAQHYDVLRDARRGRLRPAFQAKLGWLIGNLFGRPATQDWDDVAGGKRLAEKIIDEHVGAARWLDDELVDEALRRGIEIGEASEETLAALRPPTRLDRALDEIAGELGRILPHLPPEAAQGQPDVLAQKLQNRLRNSGKFKKLFT